MEGVFPDKNALKISRSCGKKKKGFCYVHSEQKPLLAQNFSCNLLVCSVALWVYMIKIKSLYRILWLFTLSWLSAPTFNCFYFDNFYTLLLLIIISALMFWLGIICKLHIWNFFNSKMTQTEQYIPPIWYISVFLHFCLGSPKHRNYSKCCKCL